MRLGDLIRWTSGSGSAPTLNQNMQAVFNRQHIQHVTTLALIRPCKADQRPDHVSTFTYQSLLHPLLSPSLFHFYSECMGFTFSPCLHVGVCPLHLSSLFLFPHHSCMSAILPSSLYPPSVYPVPYIHPCCHAGRFMCQHGSMGGCLLNSIAFACALSKEEQCFNREMDTV